MYCIQLINSCISFFGLVPLRYLIMQCCAHNNNCTSSTANMFTSVYCASQSLLKFISQHRTMQVMCLPDDLRLKNICTKLAQFSYLYHITVFQLHTLNGISQIPCWCQWQEIMKYTSVIASNSKMRAATFIKITCISEKLPHRHHTICQGFSTVSKFWATFTLHYQLPDGRVINENCLLKHHGNLLKMLLITYYWKQVHI